MNAGWFAGSIQVTPLKLKKHFHQLIEKIDNEDLLIKFYDLMKRSSSSREGQLWNRLTKEEHEKLIYIYQTVKLTKSQFNTKSGWQDLSPPAC